MDAKSIHLFFKSVRINIKDIYKTNGSHGCVNMQNDAAKTLYENVEANTRVLVHK